jgi:beta-glucosidase
MNGFTPERPGARQFPHGFLWGTGTSAYQIEGAVSDDGRAPSIWDVYTHTPGTIHNGDTGDVACDSYHRLDDDIEVLAELGVNAYRFSVSWPRVQPSGDGPVNQAGLDHYRRLAMRLRESGIVPVATLYHWDLPQALSERGGWPNRDIAQLLGEYAAIMGEALGDLVGMWITVNEPLQVVNQGYRTGTHAPGVRDETAAAAATHHIMLGHGLALQALRATAGSEAKIGITVDPNPYVAYDETGYAVADIMDAEYNRMYLDPVLQGRYAIGARAHTLPPDALIRTGDMDLISAPIDFLGVNFYRAHYIRSGNWDDLRHGEVPLAGHPGFVEYLRPDVDRTVMNWLIVPDALHGLLVRLRGEAGSLPLYVTENGCAVDDYVTPEGTVNDYERIAYIHAHLNAISRAIEEGIDVAGYFHWTLLDNFEWAQGYRRRFGLYYVEFDTGRRLPKRSAEFYRELARTGVLPTRDEALRRHPSAAAPPASSVAA